MKKSKEELSEEYFLLEPTWPDYGKDIKNAFIAGYESRHDELSSLKKELAEQYRINGMGAQRELALQTKLGIAIDGLNNAKRTFGLILTPPGEEPKSIYECGNLWFRDKRDAREAIKYIELSL